MASKANAAKGTKLQRGDGATPENFTTIGEVTTFNGPNKTVNEIDVTSFDSEAEEFVFGVPSNGEVSFEFNFVGSNVEQQGLQTDADAGTKRNYRIVLNDHATSPTRFDFLAGIKAVGFQGQGPNAAYKGSCTLKISGEVTRTYAPT